MKKINNKLIFILVSFIFNTISSNQMLPLKKIAFDNKRPINSLIDYQKQINSWLNEKSDEGFVVGTKVKTPDGYKFIEDIALNDIVVSQDIFGNYNETRVTNVLKKYISNYVKIVVDDQIIYVAPYQRFYLAQEKLWSSARFISSSDILLKNYTEFAVVTNVEIINKNIEIYELSVENQNFCVTLNDNDNIHVHNSDPIAAAELVIDFITAYDPVEVCIGIGAFLGIIALKTKDLISKNKMLDADEIKKKNINLSSVDQNNIHILLKERHYYDQRKHDLSDLKQHYIAIKNGLASISSLCRNDYMNISFRLLNEILNNNFPQGSLQVISHQAEIMLNNDEKKKLRKLRENELEQLEEEILDAQISISFHFNELIKRMENAYDDFFNLNYNNSVNKWNANQHNATYYDAVDTLEADILFEEYLENFKIKHNELKCAIEYYKHPLNAKVFKNTSTISNLLNDQEKNIQNNESDILKYTQFINYNLVIIQNYFQFKNIDYSAIQLNYKNKCIRERQIKNAQEVEEALQRRSKLKFIRHLKEPYTEQEEVEEAKSITQNSSPGGPKKDDDEHKCGCGQKCDKPNGKYENASYHHQNSSGSKSPAPKDGQTALNHSVGIEGTLHRIGLSKNEIVILNKTERSLYHGHIRTWKELTIDMQKALNKAGWIKNFKRGKIKWPEWANV